MTVDFQRAFEAVPGLYMLLSPDLHIIGVSDAYARATLQTREGMVGLGLFEVFPDNPGDPSADGVKNLRASLQRVLRDKVSDTMPLQRYDVRKPGDNTWDVRYWKPVNAPVLDANGAVEFIVHSAEDVTAMVLLQQQQEVKDRAAADTLALEHQRLTEAVIELEAANEELQAFSYSVAHDLRAPLRAIQGFSQAFLEDYGKTLDETGGGYLSRVSGAAIRMSELIDDLLTLSRISRSPVSRVPIDVTSLARSVAADTAPQHAHPVELTVQEGIGAKGDPRLLRIVLENLLGNAWKFSAKTPSPRVEVGVAETDRGRAIFVRDNGAGFDETYASKLFAPFQRLHSDKEFAGTGIGLAIVQRIVRRHGGRVWANGARDAGATFYFSLPD